MNMKQRKIRQMFSRFFIILLANFYNTLVYASEECQHFKLTSYVTLLGPTGPAVGVAEVVLKDGTILPISATGELISMVNNADGSIDMRLREMDDWGDLGVTIGLDRAKLIPDETPGEFVLEITTFIVGESGLLENAFGFYQGNGVASFNDGTLTHSGEGKICNFKRKHVDSVHVEPTHSE